MVFFPYMAQGHMLPMIDIAKLFAARGVSVTIITTPANAPLIRPTIDHYNSPINLHLIPFPSAAVGLPDGCENRISLPSESLRGNFYRGIAMLRQPFDNVLKDLRPDCVVTDMFMPWTYHVATERGIPRLVFDGSGFLSRCADDVFERHRPLDNLPPNASSFIHPGLPHRIELLLSQTLEHSKRPPGQATTGFDIINNQRKEVDPKSYGVLVNSFYELEPDFVEHYRNVVGRKAWHIGPVSLCNQNVADKSLRGAGQLSLDGDRCLKWLERQKPGSVVYVCFGSATVFVGEQIREIALGLEAAGHPFVWVVRNANEEWFPKGFEERINIEGKGMLIRGWAQQLMILNHDAVGGFVTHCGWNSVLEGISAGLPIVTWPLFAEQFYNEKLLVQLVKVGVEVGSKVYSLTSEYRPVVGAALVEEAVRRVMGDGEEAEGRRRRAKDLGEKARRAVEKGGSSYNDIGNLINELLERKVKVSAAGAQREG